MIKLIIFDLDDTLYNEKDFVLEGFKEVCTYLSQKHSISFDRLYSDIKNILKDYGRGETFNILCKKHDIDEDIKSLVNIYRETKPKLKLYCDAEHIIEYLKNDYKTGIITDGMASVQWNKIKALNLEERIDKIIVTDDYGKESWKPSTKAFEIMLEHFKVNPHESVYIGDNPNKDFIPCKRMGINSIRIIREEGDHMKTFMSEEYEACTKIKSLTDVKRLLK